MSENWWKENADKHSDDLNAKAREGRKQGRDIGPPDPPAKPERKAAAREDFGFFCKQYLPEVFALPWSPDHLRAIEKIEDAVLRGKLFAFAMPRGSGKTTLSEIACLWSLLYGHHQFVVFVGASEVNAKNSLVTLKGELEENDLLHEDFAEVTHPIRALEGSIKRADLQHIGGTLTRIGWTSNELVLPTVRDVGDAYYRSSGSTVKVRGIEGAIRGLKTRLPDGSTARPSLVIIDDCQTDESAHSASQCETRERTLSGAILNLSGPGQKIAGIFPTTVIRQGDMADRILDRKIHPEWSGERFKLIYNWPLAAEMWSRYLDIRREEFETDGDGSQATEFYREHREEMDEGAVVAWEERFNSDELSAIQHAYNLRSRDENAFFAEYQNEPISDEDDSLERIDPRAIARKVSGLERLEIPQDAQEVVTFVDVQKAVLFYTTIAWEQNFTGHVVDYGTFPKQKSKYFTTRKLTDTIQKRFKGMDLEGQLYKALEALDEELALRPLIRDDGAEMRSSKLLVDANWGDSTNVVYNFCRHAPREWIPCHGKFYGASTPSINEHKRKPGERAGDHWRFPPVTGKRVVRHLIYDTNFWKSFLLNRLNTPFGSNRSLSFWKAEPSSHRLIADHINAEYQVPVSARGREVIEWKLKPEKSDNHWFDCLVGCCVAGSIAGCRLEQRTQRRRRRIEYL